MSIFLLICKLVAQNFVGGLQKLNEILFHANDQSQDM